MSISSEKPDAQKMPLAPLTSRDAALKECAQLLLSAGIDDPYFDARLLVCAAAQITQLDLIRQPEAKLCDRARERLDHYTARRVKSEPVSRILGIRGFWNVELAITSDVLDPRPDTETLVTTAIEILEARRTEALKIADLGTGSGALICALLEMFPNAVGAAVDISQSACDVARGNLLQCGFQSRCSVSCGSWRCIGTGPFDLVVSNPPYIPTGDIPDLPLEVRNFDPSIALDGGSDGLSAYREIVPLLRGLLAPEGWAIFEIGYNQKAPVTSIIKSSGLDYMGVRVDFGGNPRAILARQS